MSILLVVLVLLNTYPVWLLQQFIFTNKNSSLSAAANLISGQLNQIDPSTERIVRAVEQLEGSITAADRLVVCNTEGYILYDNAVADNRVGKILVDGDVVSALDGQDVFRCVFRNGVFVSAMTTPIITHGETFGVLYLAQNDLSQGNMLLDLQYNLFLVSVAIFLVGMLFSLFISVALTRRVSGILHGIGMFYEGNYDYAVPERGQDELAEVAGHLNKLAGILKKTEALRQQFVSNASHELKTPLAAVRLLTDSILQTPDMPLETIREFVADIGDETERLSRMTEKLMVLSRLEAQPGQDHRMNPVPAIEKAAHMLQPLAKAADVSLSCETSGDCVIMGNEDDLYQILYNLMDNAVKYNIPGGSVLICCFQRDRTVYITVNDTGVGISEAHLPQIFDRFYRVDKARSRLSGGAGLGLSIVAHTVERMGGKVSAESTTGKGSRFTLAFPALPPEEKEEP